MLDITKEHYASVLCTWLLPRLQSMHAITTSSVHHVCCGLQFKADDYTDFHSILLKKNVYDTMCAHGLHALEACYSSDALVLSVDHTTVQYVPDCVPVWWQTLCSSWCGRDLGISAIVRDHMVQTKLSQLVVHAHLFVAGAR